MDRSLSSSSNRSRSPSPEPLRGNPRRLHLPHELVVEIFRQRTLENRDLCKCALVGRRYLNDVREILYEDLRVILYENEGKPVNDGEEDVCGEMKYTKQAYSILRTLLDNRHVARMVRAVFFEVFSHRAYIGALSPTNLVTTQLNTLSTFLGIATNVKKIHLGRGWKDSDYKIEILLYRERLHSLSLSTASAWTFSRINEHLCNLRCLEIDGFVKGGWRQSTFAGAKSIDTIVSRATGTVIFTPWILASSTTLRTLKVTAAIACDLDFSCFPRLLDLEVYPLAREPSLVDYANSGITSDKFWKSLCTSPSLTRISFEFSQVMTSTGEGLFMIFSRDSSSSIKSIPTLRTVRFLQNVFLDRLQFLLASPLASTLSRVVIPAELADARYSRDDCITYRAVLAMCEQVGIELYLTDDYYCE